MHWPHAPNWLKKMREGLHVNTKYSMILIKIDIIILSIGDRPSVYTRAHFSCCFKPVQR